jgi:HEAT repeat protein
MLARLSRSRLAPLVCGLTLLTMSACWVSPASSAADVHNLLDSPAPNRWLDAVEYLAAADNVAALIRLLCRDSRPFVRTAAALVLPLFQEEHVIAALSQAVTDQETWVKLAAIEALAFLGGT